MSKSTHTYRIENLKDQNLTLEFEYKGKVKTITLLAQCESGEPRGVFKSSTADVSGDLLDTIRAAPMLASLIERKIIDVRMVG